MKWFCRPRKHWETRQGQNKRVTAIWKHSRIRDALAAPSTAQAQDDSDGSEEAQPIEAQTPAFDKAGVMIGALSTAAVNGEDAMASDSKELWEVGNPGPTSQAQPD